MNKLFNADCFDIFPTIESNSIDLILTDPPYSFHAFTGREITPYGNNEILKADIRKSEWDYMTLEQYIDFLDKFFEEASRVLKPNGTALIFGVDLSLKTIKDVAIKHGFIYKITGTWHKTNPFPMNMQYQFVSACENWIYFIKEGTKKTGTFNNNKKCIHNFVETGITPNSERKFGKHPSQKPEKLISHFVEILSNEGDIVLDPFMGSGTTGVCCKDLNRDFIGIEKEEEYFNIANQRMEKEKC